MNRGLIGRVRKRGCEQGRAAAACEKRVVNKDAQRPRAKKGLSTRPRSCVRKKGCEQIPQKTPNFFSLAAGCHKDVYMTICPTPKTSNFFACGGLLQRCVYRHLLPQLHAPSNFFSPAAGCHIDVYMVICEHVNPELYIKLLLPLATAPQGKNFRPFFWRYLSQKKKMSTYTPAT